jgi:hypothetical protein
MMVRAEEMECWMRQKKGQQRRMLARAEGMEWMKEKEKPAKENAGKGGGKGMLNETEEKAC